MAKEKSILDIISEQKDLDKGIAHLEIAEKDKELLKFVIGIFRFLYQTKYASKKWTIKASKIAMLVVTHPEVYKEAEEIFYEGASTDSLKSLLISNVGEKYTVVAEMTKFFIFYLSEAENMPQKETNGMLEGLAFILAMESTINPN